MRVLIQNCNSHDYVAANETWVPEHEDALAFPSTVAALEYMHDKSLDPVQIVMKFENAYLDCPVSKSAGCE
jgi:hypothetical protein